VVVSKDAMRSVVSVRTRSIDWTDRAVCSARTVAIFSVSATARSVASLRSDHTVAPMAATARPIRPMAVQIRLRMATRRARIGMGCERVEPSRKSTDHTL
jgi:hypothetical protein